MVISTKNLQNSLNRFIFANLNLVFKKMNRILIVLLAIVMLSPAHADEGMWIPLLLQQTSYQRMKELGMELTPEDIYSINQSSLKDAVVLFGSGCTGVVVSDQGLLLTNHHCGYGQIQSHSSLEHDYLTDGFWAKSLEEELPNPGLSVAFLQRMEDVTDQVLRNITPAMNEQRRADSIRIAVSRIRRANLPDGSYRVEVKPLYKGNQYFMYVYEVYNDVRLVGAPPSSIGKFGGDTDNWMWPRHTGDFSVFRIYADQNNQPANYSPDNVPYRPRRHVQVTTAGIRQGEFTMVYGYPAATDEYISSYELDYLVNQEYPARVAMRTKRLEIMDGYMRADRATGIQYAAKYASVSNAWKKWQGVIRGVNRVDGVGQKQAYEESFMNNLQSNPEWAKDYGQLLTQVRRNTEALAPLNLVLAYYPETVFAIELVRLSGQYDALIANSSNTGLSKKALENFLAMAADFYKNYSPVIDKEIFVAMLKAYYEQVPSPYHFDEMNARLKKYRGSFERWADEAYSQSFFRSYETLREALTNPTGKTIKKMENDPFLSIYHSGRKMLDEKVRTRQTRLSQQADSLSRVYMFAQLLTDRQKNFYPDANQTLRVAFGRMEGYSPADAVEYRSYTTLAGVMEKDNPDIEDYQAPQALKKAYNDKDFGRYAIYENNAMPVCFSASNHTSGGNSGSPVFNYKGDLVGLNFDRNWEGTMSDLLYDPDQCRNIIVDIRYVLFIIDKVYGASQIVDEMKLRCQCEE